MKNIIKKEQRQENILLSLKKLDYLNRSQLQKMHRLGSNRNATRVLKDMSELISSFRHGENVYYLNKKGRELVKSKKICKKTIQVNHYLMRNWLYIDLGSPLSWKNEMEINIESLNLSVICDAMFFNKDQMNIVEVDFSQKMNANREKIKKYKRLKEEGAFMIAPKFHWVTTTYNRQRKLLELCEGLNVNVSLAQDFI
jgi:hypothetical protein